MVKLFKLEANVQLSLRLKNLLQIDDQVEIDTSYITCAEYQLFIDEKRKAGENRQPDHWMSPQFPPGEAQTPISGVRASDAEEFCEWLTQKYAEWGIRYRLPRFSEAQNHPLPDSQIGYWCQDESKTALVGIEPEVDRVLPDHRFVAQDFDRRLTRDRQLVHSLSHHCERLLSDNLSDRKFSELITVAKILALVGVLGLIFCFLWHLINQTSDPMFLRFFAFVFIHVLTDEDVDYEANDSVESSYFVDATEDLVMILGVLAFSGFAVLILKSIIKTAKQLFTMIHFRLIRKPLVAKYYDFYPILNKAIKIERELNANVDYSIDLCLELYRNRTDHDRENRQIIELINVCHFWSHLSDFLIEISKPSKIWIFQNSNRKKYKKIGLSCSKNRTIFLKIYNFLFLIEKRKFGDLKSCESIRIVREKKIKFPRIEDRRSTRKFSEDRTDATSLPERVGVTLNAQIFGDGDAQESKSIK